MTGRNATLLVIDGECVGAHGQAADVHFPLDSGGVWFMKSRAN